MNKTQCWYSLAKFDWTDLPPWFALPHLSTRRLLLMPLQAEQAQTLAWLADEPEIADNAAALPSPYTVENAREFIAGQEEQYRSARLMGLGIHTSENRELVGVISLRFSPDHDSAHLGYWIGVQYRNRGYAGEAVGAMLEHGFVERRLHRIAGQCFRRTKPPPGSWTLGERLPRYDLDDSAPAS